MNHYSEHDALAYSTLSLPIEKVLVSEQTPYQKIEVFESDSRIGKVLLLDGIIQVTDSYEFAYHEMMVHVPMHISERVRRILVLWWGDGGIVRELLKYTHVEEVTLCEIDQRVIDISREYFPNLVDSLSDSRVKICIADGGKFVEDAPDKSYDLIVSDSTDPISVGKSLYGEQFYNNILRILSPEGIMIGFSESPFSTPELFSEINRSYRNVFPYSETFLTYVPMYDSGCWSFVVNSKSVMDLSYKPRSDISYANLRYFNENAFKWCFLLPKFVEELI